jgi:hypothetical protein
MGLVEIQDALKKSEGRINLGWIRDMLGTTLAEMAEVCGFNGVQSYAYWERKGILPPVAAVKLAQWLDEKDVVIKGERIDLINAARRSSNGG